MTLAGIFKLHSKFLSRCNKKPRGQPSNVIVPAFPLSECVVEELSQRASPPKVRQEVEIPCQFFIEGTRPHTSFRNRAISLSNRRRKLIIFLFVNYETVPHDLNVLINVSITRSRRKKATFENMLEKVSTLRHTSHPDHIQYSYVIIIQLYIQCQIALLPKR